MRNWLIGFLLTTSNVCLLTLPSHVANAIGAPAGAPGGGGGAGGAAPAMMNINGAFTPLSYSPVIQGAPNSLCYPVCPQPYVPMSQTQMFLQTAGLFAPQCLALLPTGTGTARVHHTSEDIRAAADSQLDNSSEPIHELDSGDAKKYGSYGVSALRARGGVCQKFFDENFHLSGWGIAIKDHEDFAKIAASYPSDADILCPGFKSMSGPQRQAFWIEFFAALATPESQCQADATNKNAPHGTAKGLFQLSAALCPPSDQDLLNPYRNIDCAVKIFAREIETRNSIMVDTSKSRHSTYWGTLRLNPDRKSGDANASDAFRSEVSKFPGCAN